MQRTRMNTTKTWSPRRSRAGFTLLEVIVALIVITSMLSVAAVWLSRYNDRVANELVAGQMRRLGDAVKHYVDDNVAEISKGSTPQHIPWDKVKPYLPPGLNQNVVNPLGQTYDGRLRIVTLPNGGKRVDTMIYTSGTVDIARHSMKIARLIGAGGLYFDWNRVKGVPGNTPTYWDATGQVDDPSSLDSFWFGGKLTTSDISQIMYVPYLGDATGNDPDLDSLLHRKAVAGKPELNRMETDIDMNSNRLNKVGAIAFEGGTREVTGVKRIQFEKTNADPVSVAISYGGWFTIGDPTSKRTNLWANAIEADGDLTVHANSTVEGSSTVKGSSSVGGDASVGGTVSANRVETKGAVVAGWDIALTKGDLILGDPITENTSCGAVGHVNRNSAGDLAVCKKSGSGSLVWSRVGEPLFSQGTSGSYRERFTGNNNNTTYAGAITYNYPRPSSFHNTYAKPVFVTAISDGDYTRNKHSRCFIGVYPANSSGTTSGGTYPIAYVNRPFHTLSRQRSGDSDDWLYDGTEGCSATFIAAPGARYNVVAGSNYGQGVQFVYTY